MTHEKDSPFLLHFVLSPSLVPSLPVPKQHQGSGFWKKMLAKFHGDLNTKILMGNVYLAVLVGTSFCSELF